MPIFEYECGSCGNRFEELMRRSDPDPSCPTCDGTEVSRLISHTSFRLKGKGWYTTDYSRTSQKGNNGEASDGKPPERKSSSESGTKSESSGDKSAAAA